MLRQQLTVLKRKHPNRKLVRPTKIEQLFDVAVTLV
jgi:hypothetical protein